MKKTICLITAFIICMAVVGVVSYKLGLKNGREEAESARMAGDDIHMSEVVGKIDYPLIDIAFNDGNEWAILIVNGQDSGDQTYLLCHDGRELQFDKEYLSVITYPSGRGTTGTGSIVVYQNGEEIKCIEFVEINFEKEELKNKFQEVSREELSEFMKNIK